MLLTVGLSKDFWTDAVNRVCYLIIKGPHSGQLAVNMAYGQLE